MDNITQYVAIKKNEILLYIGIMSSQNNFEARQSIRDTWLKLAEQRDIKYAFLVGNEICSIPPEDRIYEEDCLEWIVDATGSSEFSTAEIDLIPKKNPLEMELYIGFTFLVHHPIVIRSINVQKDLVTATTGLIRVSLINSFSREKIVSATFSSNENNSGPILLQKSVEPYVLPKGFEGQILVETINNKRKEITLNLSDCLLQWNNASGLITFLQLIGNVNENPVSFHDRSCTFTSLSFSLHERGELQLHVANKDDRRKTWKNKTALLMKKLLKESEEKKDILFLDVIDVYRNLPRKLAQFFKWAHLNADSTYVMKTDDDTFINVAEVTKNLKYAKKEQLYDMEGLHTYWWSSFREGWPVQSFGKWREDTYRSATYPPFPCGAGYVLSRDLIQFLGSSAFRFLYKGFQGEDVALGIWLAGVNPQRYPNDMFSCTWACDGTCNPQACNRVQLSVDGMYESWHAFRNCSNFCGCQWT
ncbi:UDP-GalNAc:beta-1,3-N-acetylgalactosaminyltransferase 2-like isoform X3 [Periplaneta americana]|uniref:UDP-GalNAc:beta-1, 3-N-acetylgalactosaminyltransferase 2-like isoform X3 n=1 Tax=Periplaneta americana TaxID=6978 RepID=UPI0037E90CDD